MRSILLSLILFAGPICAFSQQDLSFPAGYEPIGSPDRTRVGSVKDVFRSKADLLGTAEVRTGPEQDREILIHTKAKYYVVDTQPELSQDELIRSFEKPEYIADSEGISKQSAKKGFDWKGAMYQSGLFLAAQHGYRFTESKTRHALRGRFFHDWRESVGNLKGWSDGGKFFTNYIAHPAEGSVYSRIFINNSEYAKTKEFGKSKEYWISRLKALAWTAAWSTQFEIGPISEASIGNVGQRLDAKGRSGLTYLDIVITPTFGFGLSVVEDAVDKFVLKNWIERRVQNRTLMKFFRVVLTPTTAFANLMRFRAPWWREDKVNRK